MVVCKILFVIFAFVVSWFNIKRILYYVQLGGYSQKSLLLKACESLCLRWAFGLFYCVVVVVVISLKISSVHFCLLFLIISFALICVIGKSKYECKIVFTKRMFRIIATICILFAISLVVCVECLDCCVLCVCSPLVLCWHYVLVSLAIFILTPIEKIIGMYFIRKAKKILKENKRLVKIGITGSFGKTSTKDILATILDESFHVLSTPKSYNTPFGITKTINENLKNVHEVFVCEMGAKARGEISYLCNLVNVDYGIVTSVGRQHTNTFGGIEGVYKTKKELPDFLFNKTCVFNLMNRYTMKMYKEHTGKSIGVYLVAKRVIGVSHVVIKKRLSSLLVGAKNSGVILFEFPKKNSYCAKNIVCDENGSVFDVWCGRELLFTAQSVLIGYHNVLNIMLAISISKQLGVSDYLIQRGVSRIRSIKARMEKFVAKNGAVIINNGYNSNIDSAKYTFETLKLFKKSKKIIVTPGLVETEDDFTYNRKFGELLSQYCDEVIILKKKNKDAILLGLSNMCFDMNNVRFADRFEDLTNYLRGLDGDSVVLIENDLPDNYR